MSGQQAVMGAIDALEREELNATIPAIARHLDVSEGTARRYVTSSEGSGFCERVGGGGRHPVFYRLTENGRMNLVRPRKAGFVGQVSEAHPR